MNIKTKGPQTSKNPTEKLGHYQSPINIETKDVVFDPKLTQFPLKINYDNQTCFQLKNTGYTFQVDGFTDNLSGII
jgi:carbonic anhydrase